MLALLVMGSATLLFSCGKKSAPVEYDVESLMTELSHNRTITMTENGQRSYTFSAPLIEGYSLAKNPYQEFPEGVKMITYTSDSLSLESAIITANYAIYYDKQKLWEAKGRVVIIKKNRKDGDTAVVNLTEVYTEQLFWDARTKKVYSNVDTKVLQADGWHSGVGFEADEDLKNIHFRKYKSEMEFDFTPVDESEQNKDKQSAETKSDKSDKSGQGSARDAMKRHGEEQKQKDAKAKSKGKPNSRNGNEMRNFNPSASPATNPHPLPSPTRNNGSIPLTKVSSSVSPDGPAVSAPARPKSVPTPAREPQKIDKTAPKSAKK